MSTEIEVVDSAQTIAKIASASLANIKKNKANLVELATTYGTLTIDGVTDKDGYKKVKEGITKTRIARTDIEKVRKAEKSNILEAGKMIDAAAEELTLIVSPIEEKLKKEAQRIDDEKAEIERKELEAREAKKQARVALLFQTGLTFTGTVYTIGELSINPMQVIEYSEAQFEGFISQANVEFEAIQMAKQEEEERLEAERVENRRKQEEAEAQAELEREKVRQMEIQRMVMLDDRTDMRKSQLVDLGFEELTPNGAWMHESDYKIAASSVLDASNDDWKTEITEFKLQLKDWLVDQQNKAKAQQEKEEADFFAAANEEAVEEQVNSFPFDGPAPIVTSQLEDKLAPRIDEICNIGFNYVFEEDAYVRNGVYIPILDLKTQTDAEWAAMMENVQHYLSIESDAINDELANQSEKFAAHLETRPYQATLNFSTNMPFIDTKLGKATMRIYVEEFLYEANDGIAPNQVIESGNISESSDLLFLLLKL